MKLELLQTSNHQDRSELRMKFNHRGQTGKKWVLAITELLNQNSL